MPEKKFLCLHTHGLIISGTCPWCEVPILDGEPRPETPLRDVAIRQWNVPAMLAALEHGDKEARHLVVDNLLLKEPRPETLLSVLRAALDNADIRVRRMA